MPPKTEYKVGDEICIDSECFYTISDNGNTVTALSKYNLLVGNIYDSSADIMTPISKDIKGYGLQNERAKGQLENGLEWVGVLGYSETNYWYDKVTYKLKEEYGADYPAFVFDSNSNLYEHVKNYENHLKLLGKTSVITSLMTYEQLMYFSEIYESTGEIPTWFDDTSYWLGFSHNRTDFGVAGKYAKDNMYNIKSSFGVRPTITIDKSEI